MLCRHLCQWQIQYLNLEFSCLLFPQGHMQQKEFHQFLIYWERHFLQYLNGDLDLGLYSQKVYIVESFFMEIAEG